MKTSELTGTALDLAVAYCVEMRKPFPIFIDGKPQSKGAYSTDWAQGGPIVERERINIRPNQSNAHFKAFVIISPTGLAHRHDGPTPLIAAMRCYVASKLGDEVEIPAGL